MKKLLLFSATLLLLLLLSAIALAGANMQNISLPEEIAGYFSANQFDGCTVTGRVAFDSGTNYYFVLIKNRSGKNLLYGFRYNNSWKYWMHTSDVLPQGDKTVNISNATGTFDNQTDEKYSAPALMIYQTDSYEEYAERSSIWLLQDNAWKLRRLKDMKSPQYSIVISDNKVTYFSEVESTHPQGSVTASIQRDIRFVHLSSIQKTLKEAKAKLTTAPDLPVSAELKAQEIQFTGGKKYAVYSAPDKSSIRGANSKAVVSTNDWIQVFGKDNGWILIQYSIDSSHYRFGYIDDASLPRKANINNLGFTALSAWTTEAVTVTDDPFYSQSTLTSLPEGCWVKWLATIREWAYIESSTGDYFRGFVPLESITANRFYDLCDCPADDGTPVYYGMLTVYPDNTTDITLQAAPEGLLAKAAVGSYRLYDNKSGELILTAVLKDGYLFCGQGTLAQNTTSIRIVPVAPGGDEFTGPIVVVEW